MFVCLFLGFFGVGFWFGGGPRRVVVALISEGGKVFQAQIFHVKIKEKRSSSMETHQHSLMVRILSYHQLKLEGTLNPCFSNCS